jgi:protein gp37
MTADYFVKKGGIVGICQHGDLFWDKIPEEAIHRVLDIVEETVPRKRKGPKYVLWTKRPERMADILCARYPQGTPNYLACAVSIENQALADERLPHLLRINTTRIAVLEPMLGPVDLHIYIQDLNWVLVGSETGGKDTRPFDLDWGRQVRDEAVQAGVPFFIKQVNGAHGKKSIRILDGRTWDEFPVGFVK